MMTSAMRGIAVLLLIAAVIADNSTMTIMNGPNINNNSTSGSGGPSNATTDPCATVRCGNGTICQLQTVQCITAPCLPIAQCVTPPPAGSNSTVDLCATMRCGNGTVCQLQTVQCLVAPCPPVAQCVTPPAGPSCLTMKCAANMYCMDHPTGAVCHPNESNSTVDPCATMRCGNGTVCKVTTVNCLLPPCKPLAQCVAPSTGPSCMTMKCRANTTCVDLPTGSVCQPNGTNTTVPIDPCATMRCGNGTVCKLQTVQCVVAPCHPIAQCVAPSTGPSCMTMKCAANTTCVDLPTGSICQLNDSNTTNPCAAMLCAVGTVCKLQTVNCLVAPCNPIAQCVPQSTGPSCLTMKCAANSTCVDLPTGSVCQPNGSNTTVPTDPCATMRCGNGTVCKLQTVNCLVAPCSPIAQCVAPSTGPSCMTMKCSANTTCVDLPTGSVCQPNGDNGTPTNPCATMLCVVGTVCELQEVACIRAPCPPIGKCVVRTTNSSACLHIKCMAGFECRNGDKGETCYPVSAPKPDACANHTCPAGQSCSVVMVNCLVAPCPPPQASCIPNRDDPCATVECAKGFFCAAHRGAVSCFKASGASCAATSCPSNTTCIEFKQGAACMDHEPTSNLTCATVKCAANTRCVILPSGPTCKPIKGESPCNAMECAAGFFCIVQSGEPECVHHSGASCAATSCPVNTTCIEFRDGATCMEANLSGACANLTCAGGSRCQETRNGPRCISMGRRGNRVVDVFGCGRGEQHTMCMPQCEDNCRGFQTCDHSIPAPTNGSTWIMPPMWTNSTTGNHTMGGNSTVNLPSHCVSGCMCRANYKRNCQGNCVPNNRCWLTPGCRENESWSRCRSCEPTCANPSGAQICAAVCQAGCACDEGYVRSKRGMCVLPEDCRTIDLINGDHGNRTIAIEG